MVSATSENTCDNSTLTMNDIKASDIKTCQKTDKKYLSNAQFGAQCPCCVTYEQECYHALQPKLNDAFSTYKTLYYGQEAHSTFFADENANCFVLLIKNEVENVVWDAIHLVKLVDNTIVDASTNEKTAAGFSLEFSSYLLFEADLSLAAQNESNNSFGKISFTTDKKQAINESEISLVEFLKAPEKVIELLGKTIEALEGGLRCDALEIFVPRCQAIAASMRKAEGVSAFKNMESLRSDLIKQMFSTLKLKKPPATEEAVAE